MLSDERNPFQLVMEFADLGTLETYIEEHSKQLGVLHFKQKTAYEIAVSLVGSEMCIRDSHQAAQALSSPGSTSPVFIRQHKHCLH